MKKKVLAGILAATMAFSMAACGSTGSSSDSGSSAASGSTAKTEEKGEPYTVTMVLQGSQQQDEERIEEKINEILEPELNAKLDIVVLPWASASQQLQLMLSGDEKIDLLYTNATTAVQYMHSGQIMDMSELIDKYGTNLKDIYGEDIAKTNPYFPVLPVTDRCLCNHMVGKYIFTNHHCQQDDCHNHKQGFPVIQKEIKHISIVIFKDICLRICQFPDS